jgi:hypothetical protein
LRGCDPHGTFPLRRLSWATAALNKILRKENALGNLVAINDDDDEI